MGAGAVASGEIGFTHCAEGGRRPSLAVLLDFGGATDPDRLPLATCEWRDIRNSRRAERPADWLRAARAADARSNPNAELRSTTATYNCMGLVFASRRTWIETDELPTILNDDNCRRLKENEDVFPGDVVAYTRASGDITHVGIVLRVEPDIEKATRRITVLSKWGQHGEYVHASEDVPTLLGSPTQLWTERRPLP